MVSNMVSGMMSGVIAGDLDALVLDDTGFYDIYGMVHRPWWQHPGWKIFLCAGIFLAVFFLIARFYMKHKKENRLTPWDKALRDIARVRQVAQQESQERAQEMGSMFYVELSKIIKIYVHERYGFDILGYTDQELISWAHKQPLLAEVQDMLTIVLNGGEYIKFAGYQAARDAIARHAQVAQDIIKRTMPQKVGTPKK